MCSWKFKGKALRLVELSGEAGGERPSPRAASRPRSKASPVLAAALLHSIKPRLEGKASLWGLENYCRQPSPSASQHRSGHCKDLMLLGHMTPRTQSASAAPSTGASAHPRVSGWQEESRACQAAKTLCPRQGKEWSQLSPCPCFPQTCCRPRWSKGNTLLIKKH